LFGQPDVTVVVVDATRLERNLNLALQVMEITERVVICLNLIDEAERHGLEVDDRRLARDLGVPVVPAAARHGRGLDDLVAMIHQVASGEMRPNPRRIQTLPHELERSVHRLESEVRAQFPDLPNTRWVALRLLDGDERIRDAILKGELGDLSSGAPTENGTQQDLPRDVA
jgi:ferrous iron transport protein B